MSPLVSHAAPGPLSGGVNSQLSYPFEVLLTIRPRADPHGNREQHPWPES